jgi:hypothetical protein
MNLFALIPGRISSLIIGQCDEISGTKDLIEGKSTFDVNVIAWECGEPILVKSAT